MDKRLQYWLYCLKHPCYGLGRAIRKYRAKLLGLEYLGKNVDIRFPLHLGHPENISIGDNTVICEYVFIMAGKKAKVSIGDNVYIAPNVYITATAHSFDGEELIMEQAGKEGGIYIGNDVLIGTKTVILHGRSIEGRAIIGAGSIVTKNIRHGTVVAGVPAVTIRSRGETH